MSSYFSSFVCNQTKKYISLAEISARTSLEQMRVKESECVLFKRSTHATHTTRSKHKDISTRLWATPRRSLLCDSGLVPTADSDPTRLFSDKIDEADGYSLTVMAHNGHM